MRSANDKRLREEIVRTRQLIGLAALVLFAAACGDTADTTAGEPAQTTTTTAAETTTTAAATTTSAATTTTAMEGPPTGPTELEVEPQESDGTTVTIASVTLPAPGFVAIHGDGGGSPGAVIGHSDLLPEGTSTAVGVTLDEPLAGDATLYPMAHIDVDGDGVYEFFPPDETVDGPATFADGSVAVLPMAVTVTDMDAAGPEVTVTESALGDILTNGEGNTLYLFMADTPGEPTACTGACTDNWPAFTGQAAAGEGADASLVGTAASADLYGGAPQVTYNGWRLYYFAGDAGPGDTNGQGVGDVWWVVSPDGDPIQ
jgi:predicted lipoprotein with Yx(FWY)xxD motif